MRICVTDILGMLTEGVPQEEILADFAYLEPEDIKAALAYAESAPQPGASWLSFLLYCSAWQTSSGADETTRLAQLDKFWSEVQAVVQNGD